MKTIKRMNKKTIAVFLSVLMLLSLFPVSVFAEGDADAVISELRPVENSDIKIIGDYVRAVPEMNADKIKNQLVNENVNVVDKDGNALADDAVVGTGSKIQVLDNDGKVLSEYEMFVLGDANGDGYITAFDARLVLRNSAKLDNIDELRKLVADVDGNGRVTAADARGILRMSAELDNNFYLDYHVHKYTEKIITEPSCTKEGTAEYYCAECGDKYTAATPVRHTDGNGDGICDICNEECFATCTANIDNKHSGYEFQVSVSIKKGMDLRSADLVLNYDPDAIEFVEAFGSLIDEGILTRGCPVLGKATVSCVFLEKSYLQSVDLCKMTFKALTNKPTNISLSVKSIDDKIGGQSDVLIPVSIGEGHDYTNIDIVEPTCTTNGSKTYTCAICGDSYTEVIPATGHKDGYYDGNYDGVCDYCGEIMNAAVVLSSSQYEDMLYVSVGITGSDGFRCADLEFNYEPECLEYAGFRSSTQNGHCSIAGGSAEKGKCTLAIGFNDPVDTNYIDIGHFLFKILKYGDTDVVPSVISWEGTKTPLVQTLNLSLEENLCAHNYVKEIVTPPTCSEWGVALYTCSVCGNTYKETVAPQHTDSNGDGVCDICGVWHSYDFPSGGDLVIKDSASIALKDSYVITVPNTSVDGFKEMIENENVKFFDKDFREFHSDELVGTGCQIHVFGDDGKVRRMYEVVIPMDVDGNAKITAADARLALRQSAKLEKLGGVFAKACDADGKLGITAADARKILRVSAKLDNYNI